MLLNGPIWILLDSSAFGGIESHVLELAKGLTSHDQLVTVMFLSSYKPEPPLMAQLRDANIKIEVLDQTYTNSSFWLRLKQAITEAKVRPVVIHAHGYKANILLRITRLLAVTDNIKLVCSFHAGETPTGRVRWYDALDRLSAFLTEQRICVSRKIQSKLPCSSQLINNFVPEASLVESTGNNIAFVGRLSEEKGPDVFVSIANQMPETPFHIYGSGNMEPELTKIKTNNVTFHGHQANMASIWPNIDILLITSRYEGLPMAALEAMSRGIPIISFALGELPSLIDSGRNGWIVDSMQQMIERLRHWRALTHSEKMHIKMQAQQTIEQNYSTQVVIPQMLAMYQR